MYALEQTNKYDVSRNEHGELCFRPKAFGQAWLRMQRERHQEGFAFQENCASNVEHAFQLYMPPSKEDEEEANLDDRARYLINNGENLIQDNGTYFNRKLVKNSNAHLPWFTFEGEAEVIKDIASLEKACHLMRHLLPPASSDLASTPALGMDVEYARLECDLRMQPALLVFSLKRRAWLIWLDKFQSHGRNLLSKSHSLASILADDTILKVGVGTQGDANELMGWSEGEVPTIRGVVDMGKFEIATVRDKPLVSTSLVHMCEASLSCRLRKRKYTGGGRGSLASKMSHSRADSLSKDMKKYAIEDAAAGLAIWYALIQYSCEDAQLKEVLESNLFR